MTAYTSQTTGPDPVTEPPLRPLWTRLVDRATVLREAAMEYCIPRTFERDTEPYRRARLITGFGLLGFVFGCIYATFYLLIGHVFGAAIVIVCSLLFAAVPFLLRRTGNISLGGNLLTLVLLVGFSALCAIEGGVRGHAIGWLASVPLCALLLVGGPEAAGWCVLSAVATACFVILDLNGVRLPLLYAQRWHQLVTAAGYMGLTMFMSVLGLIFEGGRRRAFGRMELALKRVSEFNDRLKRLDAEKNEFLGIAAHDLKNPLGIVMGFAEIIASGKNGSAQKNQQDAQYIIDAADRMISLITQLLDVNAIEQGRFPLELSTFDMGAVSQKVIDSFSAAATKKGISVFVTGPLTPAMVVADSKATYRILDNLLSNAIKYTPPGSDIYVRMRNSPSGVVWEVQDQGAGLTAADQAKLFQKFTKLSARPTGGESSTGLGLSIVKMLAEAMQGSVECQSTPGHGATFSVRLPTAPYEETVAPAPAQASEAVS
jgi:signal transduction histidine kinase